MLNANQRKLLKTLLQGPENLVNKFKIYNQDSTIYSDYNHLQQNGFIEPVGNGNDQITEKGKTALQQ